MIFCSRVTRASWSPGCSSQPSPWCCRSSTSSLSSSLWTWGWPSLWYYSCLSSSILFFVSSLSGLSFYIFFKILKFLIFLESKYNREGVVYRHCGEINNRWLGRKWVETELCQAQQNYVCYHFGHMVKIQWFPTDLDYMLTNKYVFQWSLCPQTNITNSSVHFRIWR